MNGPQHYAEAERLVSLAANSVGEFYSPETRAEWTAEAQVHATLALVAVTAEAAFDPDGRPLIAKSDATEQWAEVRQRFRVAAELVVQDVRAQRGDHIAGLVEDSFAAHFARAER